VTEAENGREALDTLAAEHFDLELLDVHMPIMGGQQTIKAIRRSPESWRAIPVIALTADAMSGDREKYLALGMDDYLAKPVDQRELHAKIAAILKLQDEALMQPDTAAEPDSEISQSEVEGILDRMDRAAASSGGDRAICSIRQRSRCLPLLNAVYMNPRFEGFTAGPFLRSTPELACSLRTDNSGRPENCRNPQGAGPFFTYGASENLHWKRRKS
jgi:CheY-like chemotaxis protein